MRSEAGASKTSRGGGSAPRSTTHTIGRSTGTSRASGRAYTGDAQAATRGTKVRNANAMIVNMIKEPTNVRYVRNVNTAGVRASGVVDLLYTNYKYYLYFKSLRAL